MLIKKSTLMALPQLEGYTIITSVDDLRVFFSTLRQDWFPPEKLSDLGVERVVKDWIEESSLRDFRFYAVHNEPDGPSNDNWGQHTLWQCIACPRNGGTIDILKGISFPFAH